MIYSIFAGNDVICKDPLRERLHSSEMCLYIVHLYTNSKKKKENKSRIETNANHDCKLTIELGNRKLLLTIFSTWRTLAFFSHCRSWCVPATISSPSIGTVPNTSNCPIFSALTTTRSSTL